MPWCHLGTLCPGWKDVSTYRPRFLWRLRAKQQNPLLNLVLQLAKLWLSWQFFSSSIFLVSSRIRKLFSDFYCKRHGQDRLPSHLFAIWPPCSFPSTLRFHLTVLSLTGLSPWHQSILEKFVDANMPTQFLGFLCFITRQVCLKLYLLFRLFKYRLKTLMLSHLVYQHFTLCLLHSFLPTKLFLWFLLVGPRIRLGIEDSAISFTLQSVQYHSLLTLMQCYSDLKSSQSFI